MTRIVDCGKVNPGSNCDTKIRGQNDEEVLRKAGEHAVRDHGMQPTPELIQKVRAHIEDDVTQPIKR